MGRIGDILRGRPAAPDPLDVERERARTEQKNGRRTAAVLLLGGLMTLTGVIYKTEHDDAASERQIAAEQQARQDAAADQLEEVDCAGAFTRAHDRLDEDPSLTVIVVESNEDVGEVLFTDDERRGVLVLGGDGVAAPGRG